MIRVTIIYGQGNADSVAGDLKDLVELIKNCSSKIDDLKTAVEAQGESF